MLSHSVWLFATPRTVARQAPLSLGCSKQEHWSALLFPLRGDLPDPGINSASLVSPTLELDSLPLHHWEVLIRTFSTFNKILRMQHITIYYRNDVVQQIPRAYSPCWTKTLYLLNDSSLLLPSPSSWQPPFYSLLLSLAILVPRGSGILNIYLLVTGFFLLAWCPPCCCIWQDFLSF